MRMVKGFELIEHARYQLSLKTFEELLKGKARDAMAIRGRALSFVGLGKHKQAEIELSELAFLRPNAVETQEAMVRLLIQRKKYQEAAEQLEQLLEKFPEEPRLYQTRALIYDSTKRKEEAKADRNRADVLLSMKRQFPVSAAIPGR